MSALNPTATAKNVRQGLSEYLATSFSLAENITASRLKEFLQAQESSMFYGPYVKTRLPYAPASDWEGILEYLPSFFKPYHHQAQAFRRLTSRINGAYKHPEPTIVVTGTGSGKTESFLYPILDHCMREKRLGAPGVKALILYPMNALANDQERRLAELLTSHEAYKDVTAGIYTGQRDGSERVVVSSEGLINSRERMRKTPPDILLTNYKMLDQLLLREEDRKIWKKSAATLQYLVLDEFHTYDAAQGTDVSLLLRRLGLTLKRFQPEGFLQGEEAERPLGRITPVATSATLGGGATKGAEGNESAVEEMLEFAFTVFGQRLSPDALVGETALTLDEWEATVDDLVHRQSKASGAPSREKILSINQRIASGEDSHDVLCEELFGCEADLESAISGAAHNELVLSVLEHTGRPISLDEQVRAVFPPEIVRMSDDAATLMIIHVLSEIAYLRAQFGKKRGWEGKKLPGVETHLWVREVTHIDRVVTSDAHASGFRWSDDGRVEDEYCLPAIYCRHCGRSGWMIALQAGDAGLVIKPNKIRRASVFSPKSVRPLIDATKEQITGHSRVEDSGSRLAWLNMELPGITSQEPSAEERELGCVVPVLTYAGEDVEAQAKSSTCPSCGETDGIRFIGSSVATLLSVAITNLFGLDELDSEEKKTLVFTDSVQDAAHRAGFVQNRSRAFALRTRMRIELGHESAGAESGEVHSPELSLAELPERILERADQEAHPARARFELLPSEYAEKQAFRPLWDQHSTRHAQREARLLTLQRLALDAALEFGDRVDLPRSLVSAGAATVRVNVEKQQLIDCVSEIVLGVDDRAKQWAYGVLEYMRISGGIYHPLLQAYMKADGNAYLLAMSHARAQGVPKFARGGAPKFPRVGKPLESKYDLGMIPVNAQRSWFAKWTRQMLGGSSHDAANMVTALFRAFARAGVVDELTTNTQASMYYLRPENIVVASEEYPRVLECNVCAMRLGLEAERRAVLEGAHCFTIGCEGTYEQVEVADNYYRRMYESQHPRSVVAKEHTSLLDDETRQQIEDEFKSAAAKQAPNAPNVLVATPTLEMGIDIGDLSTVMLSSLPRTVASYVQRVGRAGRLSGNSLVLAFASGQSQQLMRLEQPLETIGGVVQAPAAYLSAREILHRQFLAYLIDSRDLDDQIVRPRMTPSVLRDGQRTLLDAIAEWVEAGVEDELQAFSATLAPHVAPEGLEELRDWVTLDLVEDLKRVRNTWNNEELRLQEQLSILTESQKQLELKARVPTADDEVKAEHRSVMAARKLVKKQLHERLRNEYWISALERYGLLPNFTLLDDAVEFQVDIARYLENGEIAPDTRTYSRSATSALFEFAPGSTFYVQGVAAVVDSVELGQKQEAIVQWRICPSCSYSEEVSAHKQPTRICPVCGDEKIADSGCVIDVVEPTKVYASVDENRSAIDGSHETRRRSSFVKAWSFVVEDIPGMRQWFLKETGFGVQYLPKVTMRWLNLGKQSNAQKRVMAGIDLDAPLFRVCKHCGHLDSEAGRNSWRDHRPWCPVRYADREESVSFALGRKVTTQGVLLHLPQLITAADSTAIPSLVAAIRMGFKEYLGGDPTHLNVAGVRSISAGELQDMLLLHDNIPGGTGYLAQFAGADEVRAMLEKIYWRLSTCDCAQDSRRACSACLLPFTGDLDPEEISRATALSAVAKILSDDLHPDDDLELADMNWESHVVDQPQRSRGSRSELEAKFLEMMRGELREMGATLQERTVGQNVQWTMRFPASNHDWVMYEQKDFSFTRPDFYFTTADPSVRDIALYLDGEQFHISAEHNRVRGDIAKRNKLYQEFDVLPWSITWNDLEVLKKIRKGESIDPPRWYAESYAQAIAAKVGVTAEQVRVDPVTLLLELLAKPTEQRTNLWLGVMMFALASGKFAQGSVQVSHKNNLPSLTLSMEHQALAEDWREFLRLANFFYLVPEGATIKVEDKDTRGVPVEDVFAQRAEATAGVDDAATTTQIQAHLDMDVVEPSKFGAAWQEVLDEFEGEKDVYSPLETLAALVVAPDRFGDEEGGVPAVAIWDEAKVMLVYPGDATEVSIEGMTVLDAAELPAAEEIAMIFGTK